VRAVKKFVATDKEGDRYIIRVYRGDHGIGTAPSELTTVGDDQAQLWAEDGHFVIRVRSGVYDMLCGTEKVRLTSDDAEAA